MNIHKISLVFLFAAIVAASSPLFAVEDTPSNNASNSGIQMLPPIKCTNGDSYIGARDPRILYWDGESAITCDEGLVRRSEDPSDPNNNRSRVGININNPVTHLDIDGVMRAAEDGVIGCTRVTEGAIRYNKTNHIFEGCGISTNKDGDPIYAWIALGGNGKVPDCPADAIAKEYPTFINPFYTKMDEGRNGEVRWRVPGSMVGATNPPVGHFICTAGVWALFGTYEPPPN